MATPFRSPSRRLYVVGDDGLPSAGAPSRPRFDAALGLRANVVAMAQWEWGERRAVWVGELADVLVADGHTTDRSDDAAGWTAAILCAAAADSGRDRRPGSWNRTLTAVAEMTGLDRQTVLDRHALLPAV